MTSFASWIRRRSELDRVGPGPDARRIGEADVIQRAVADVWIEERIDVVQGVGHIDLGAKRDAALEAVLVAGEEGDELLVGGDVELARRGPPG